MLLGLSLILHFLRFISYSRKAHSAKIWCRRCNSCHSYFSCIYLFQQKNYPQEIYTVPASSTSTTPRSNAMKEWLIEVGHLMKSIVSRLPLCSRLLAVIPRSKDGFSMASSCTSKIESPRLILFISWHNIDNVSSCSVSYATSMYHW